MLGNLLETIGKHEEAREAYQKSAEHSAPGDQLTSARLCRLTATSWQAQREIREALRNYAIAESVLELKATESNPEVWQEWLQIQLERMWAHYWVAEVEQMSELASRLGAAVRQWGTLDQQAHFISCMVTVRFRQNRYVIDDETLSIARSYLAAAKDCGNLREISQAHFSVGFSYLWRDEYTHAEENLQLSLQLATRTGNIELQVLPLTYLTLLHRKLAHIAETQQYADQSLRAATAGKMHPYIGMAKANFAWLALKASDPARAKKEAGSALQHWENAKAAYPFQWAALWVLIKLETEASNTVEAVGHSRALLAMTQQRLPRELEAMAEACVQAWDENRPSVASEHLSKLTAIAQAMKYV